MNKFLTLLITIFLVLGMTIVYAQESTDTASQEKEDAKVSTPDSAFYGLSKARERINLAFTFNKAKKAEKQLKFAEKRLLAAQKLIKENKFDKLDQLKEEHKKLLEEAKLNLDKVSEESPETALNKQTEVETQIEEQENKLDEVSNNIDLKLAGKLNDEQLAKLKDFLSSLGNNVNDVKVKLNTNHDKLKVRLKESGKTDKEVEDKVKEIREKNKLHEVQKEVAQKHIERLEQKLAKLKELTQKHKDQGKDVTEMEQRLKDVEETIAEIKTELTNNNLDKVKELVKKASQLLNFREVFKALEKNEVAKLKELNQERLAKVLEIKKDLADLKEVREKFKAEKENIKTTREASKSKEKESSTETTGTATETSKTEATQ